MELILSPRQNRRVRSRPDQNTIRSGRDRIIKTIVRSGRDRTTMFIFQSHPLISTTCIFLLSVFFSCRPSEEVGEASYFIDNQSDYTLRIVGEYIGSVDVSCDSCEVQPLNKILLGTDAGFGYAPRPDETIRHVRIYKNDSLKLDIPSPYADSLWLRKKGKNEYDSDFTLSIGNKDVE